MRGWDPVSTTQFDVPWACGDAYDSRTQVTGLGTPDFLKLQHLLNQDYKQGYGVIKAYGE